MRGLGQIVNHRSVKHGGICRLETPKVLLYLHVLEYLYVLIDSTRVYTEAHVHVASGDGRDRRQTFIKETQGDNRQSQITLTIIFTTHEGATTAVIKQPNRNPTWCCRRSSARARG